ncbi:5-formyltetrahydrofolate cyclo-ligase [Paenibacillus solisilvae]|uniref:5-formyltetrahydrofolate cyclo-ligase n=1 Tax=Paenibacillus solisilvae TaxID=2486751 RepID=A0ABW0VSQ2_9BACL
MMEQNADSEAFYQQKKEARAAAIVRRDSLSEQLRSSRSEAACQAVIDWLEQQQETFHSLRLMVYVPFRSELDTKPLIEWGWRSHLTIIVPRCVRADRSMELYSIKGWEELVPGAYEILEPDPHKAERCADSFIPDIIIVPGLAFDLLGGRLGYGGGYYDRFYERLCKLTAEQAKRFPYWIGAGYELQLTHEVPMDPHDARLQAVVTEQGLRWTSASISHLPKGANHGSDPF